MKPLQGKPDKPEANNSLYLYRLAPMYGNPQTFSLVELLARIQSQKAVLEVLRFETADHR